MPTNLQTGVSCELLVAADLLNRGLEVTKPFVDDGDDLHVRLSTGWVSVQVKARDRSTKKWRASCGRRKRIITSRLLALVDIRTGEIRYSHPGGRTPRQLL